jgi:signal transduction histidine kinase
LHARRILSNNQIAHFPTMSGPQQPNSVFLQSRISRAALAAAGWSIIGCIFALPNINAANGWRMPLLSALALWWSWGLLSPLIFAADLRLPFSETQPLKRIAAHLALSLFFTSLLVYVLLAVRALLGLGLLSALRDPQAFPNALRGMFLWNWLIYWVIVGAWQAYQYYRRYLSSELCRERLERQFSEARLNALRMQLDPHFLFNALNTISAQLERDPRLARQMIEHLGDLLRLSLDSKDRQLVPLAEEMAFLAHYVAIQKIRFGDHLKIEIRIAPDVKYAFVPSLFVQPLVENAIRHGISRRASGGKVSVSATKSGDQLEILVLDDGVGLPPGWSLETSGGLGLSVTRERIAGLHNGLSYFSVHNRAEGGTEVKILLPLKLSLDPSKENTRGHAAD